MVGQRFEANSIACTFRISRQRAKSTPFRALIDSWF